MATGQALWRNAWSQHYANVILFYARRYSLIQTIVSVFYKLCSRFGFVGALHNTNLIQMNRRMREMYGDIYRMPGMMGKPNVVFTYNPEDFEVTYRNEGVWPIRIGLESFSYYRKVHRPDIFKGVAGLVSE